MHGFTDFFVVSLFIVAGSALNPSSTYAEFEVIKFLFYTMTFTLFTDRWIHFHH